jgi:hypothetical protein
MLEHARHLVSIVVGRASVLIRVELVLTTVMIIVELIGILLSLVLDLFFVNPIFTLGFSELVNLASNEAS